MFINSPPITLSCTRTGANAFPNENQFVIPTLHTAAGTPAVVPGDLCVVFDLCNNNNGVYPVNNTPAGFTLLFGALGSQQNGNLSKANVYAKILATADIGALRSGMIPTENARKMVCTFQMSRPVQSFTLLQGLIGGPQGTDCGTFGLGAPAIVAGTQLDLFMSCSESAHTPTQSGIFGSAPYNVSGTDDTGSVASATRAYYSMWPFLGATTHFSGPQFHAGDAAVNNANAICGVQFALN